VPSDPQPAPAAAPSAAAPPPHPSAPPGPSPAVPEPAVTPAPGPSKAERGSKAPLATLRLRLLARCTRPENLNLDALQACFVEQQPAPGEGSTRGLSSPVRQAVRGAGPGALGMRRFVLKNDGSPWVSQVFSRERQRLGAGVRVGLEDAGLVASDEADQVLVWVTYALEGSSLAPLVELAQRLRVGDHRGSWQPPQGEPRPYAVDPRALMRSLVAGVELPVPHTGVPLLVFAAARAPAAEDDVELAGAAWALTAGAGRSAAPPAGVLERPAPEGAPELLHTRAGQVMAASRAGCASVTRLAPKGHGPEHMFLNDYFDLYLLAQHEVAWIQGKAKEADALLADAEALLAGTSPLRPAARQDEVRQLRDRALRFNLRLLRLLTALSLDDVSDAPRHQAFFLALRRTLALDRQRAELHEEVRQLFAVIEALAVTLAEDAERETQRIERAQKDSAERLQLTVAIATPAVVLSGLLGMNVLPASLEDSWLGFGLVCALSLGLFVPALGPILRSWADHREDGVSELLAVFGRALDRAGKRRP
jgi:hypothetical protein